MGHKGIGNDWKEKWLKKDRLSVLILVGILLLVIALPVGGNKEGQQKGESGEKNLGIQLSGATSTESQGTLQESQKYGPVSMEYEKQMEQRLLDLLEVMAGVGEARVMITLQASQELLLDKESNENCSETRETDSTGGNRTILQQSGEETTVLLNQDGNNQPICVKTIYPQVEGVVVAAQGAGTGDISKQISELVQVLFGIDAHRVKIVRLE